MEQSMQAKVTALRDEAYQTFKALDDAVASLGGNRRIVTSVASSTGVASGNASAVGKTARRVSRAPSQSSASEAILRERGEPMLGVDLMSALPAKGIIVGGKNRRINFTSAISKSGKFRSVRKDGNYFWWFKDEPLPADWQEAPDLLVGERSDASVVGNQEGGEANATAT